MPRETRRDNDDGEGEEEEERRCRNMIEPVLSPSLFSLLCSRNREKRQKNVHYSRGDVILS